MEKKHWWNWWPHILLWAHALGVAGFYVILWWRTWPGKKERVTVLPRTQEPIDGHRRSALPIDQLESAQPLISIIVPARNEEKNIRRCVESLLAQDYSNYEVIVVDDDSTDQTAQILDEIHATHPQAARLWVLRLRDLPADWAGKPHALHCGTQEAKGEWLLFTDADTWHAPNALRSALTQAEKDHADLFSLGTVQELPTFWERALMPMAYMGISMLYPSRLVNSPHSRVAIANGQYILLRRSVYDQLGGYARPDLRATLLDDRDLAQVIKDNGYRLLFVDGCGLVHVHMYQGFYDIWRGWRKNAYLGNRGGLAFVLLELLGLPIVTISPFLLPVFSRFLRTRQGKHVTVRESAIVTCVELIPLLSYRTWLNRSLSVPWYYIFTHPVAGGIFEGILGQSMIRVLTKQGIDWRGRMYHRDSEKK